MASVFGQKMYAAERWLYKKAMGDLFFAEYIEEEPYEGDGRVGFLDGVASVLGYCREDVREDYLLLLKEIDPSLTDLVSDRHCPFDCEFVESLRGYLTEHDESFTK